MYKYNEQPSFTVFTACMCIYINIGIAVWRMRASHVLYEKGTLNLSVDSPWIPSGPLNIFTLPPPRWYLPKEPNAASLSRYRPPWRLFCNYFPPPFLPPECPFIHDYARFVTRESTCRISYMKRQREGGGSIHTRCRNIRVYRIKLGGSYG